MAPRDPPIAPWAATRLTRVESGVRDLRKIGPQPWLYVGDYPGDTFTRPESPTWQNGHGSMPGRRVALRWGLDGDVDGTGVFDLITGSPTTGTVAFNVNENTDEFEGAAFETFSPLDLGGDDPTLRWSAMVVKLYGEAADGYDAGDLVIWWPIAATALP